jgi:chemotaxis family two-component system sensor kinase Cph1
MSYPLTDLTNCDKEPIHILGKVQSLGFLVAFSKDDNTVMFVSNNLKQFTNIDYEQLLGKSIKQFFEVFDEQEISHGLLEIIRFGMANNFESVNPIRIAIQQKMYNVVCHLSGNIIVLEFEPTYSDVDQHFQSLVGSSLSKILNGKNLNDTVTAAANQVKELIGYDRVMIYQFWEDGHGEVIAEAKNEEFEPFFGLHYPASDIPKQARELYKINLTRIIADVNAIPADIVGINDKPIDLTHSTLRAVSNIHIQYLKNMGVMASFSVSIIHKGELWGLIACHNYSPRFIDYQAREHAKLVGQVLSSSFEYKADQEQKSNNLAYMNAASDIMRRMHKNWDLLTALDDKEALLKVTGATGAAVVFEGKIHKEGNTPTDEQIMELITWLSLPGKPLIYNTHSLSKYFPAAAAYTKMASGLMACAISKELGEYLLFFKPEIITTVKWGGNPEKPVEVDETGDMKLSPRRSFAVWSEEVKDTSEKWYREEINAVVKFREDIMHFLNLKSNEIRKLNEKLQEAYDELDAFSFTISHDLKTPLASVKNYAEMLLEEFPEQNENAQRYTNRIVKSADKMEKLIHEVLGYSRVSRQKFVKKEIDMTLMLEEIKSEILSAYRNLNVILIFKDTPPVMGDLGMINQVFTNILSNAIKYSSKSAQPIITLEGKAIENEVIYKIEDNGIGIDMNYGGQVFELFKRMENSREFAGTGVGLAIVKRIMTKHGGMVWFESNNAGTVFYLSFTNTKE